MINIRVDSSVYSAVDCAVNSDVDSGVVSAANLHVDLTDDTLLSAGYPGVSEADDRPRD